MGYKVTKNKNIRAYFNKLKRSVGVSSIQIAAAIDKTPQNIADLSGRIDNMNLREISIICEMFDVDVGEFVKKIVGFRKAEKEAQIALT